MRDYVAALHQALAAHDEWPTDLTRERVVDAARAALREHDMVQYLIDKGLPPISTAELARQLERNTQQ
jgi:hypothetical protein